MGTRRKAREATLQFLFQDDFTVDGGLSLDDLEQRFELFCSLYQVNKKARDYALQLLHQTIANKTVIDDTIRKCAKNWRLERLAVADRNMIRIGVSEILYSDDVPSQVAINEAVEIAKRFGGDESPAFINGILDAVRESLNT